MKSDVQLQHDVVEELEWEPSIDAAEIGVAVKGGVVTLMGHVPVYAQTFKAAEVAKRVHGVKAIANDIQVRLGDGHQPDDADIAAAALHALKWDASVPDERLQIAVRDGWITVDGTVDWPFEREAADRVLRHLIGALGVTNTILVKPRETANDVKSDIEAAFRRSATLDAKKIWVETKDGAVTLHGEVHSHAERDEAERIAWTAPGVRRVEDCITIAPWEK